MFMGENMKIGDIIGNRYEVKAYLGKGASAKVYLVYDIKLGKEWAAKKIDRSFWGSVKPDGEGSENKVFCSEMMGNELKALKSINHPAFPRIADIYIGENGIYLIMDYIYGKSLEVIIKEDVITEEIIFNWAIQLAEALNYLHLKNPSMLYLDCKPSNIIIGKNKELKLVDLGSIYFNELKNGGRVSGTMGYASPEQISGGAVDIRSDIYSYGKTLGVIIQRMDKGRGNIKSSTLNMLKDIVEKSTEDMAIHRYQSMREILNKLENRDNIAVRVKYTIVGMLSYFYKMVIALFTVISYYTFGFCREWGYFILATLLFTYLFFICSERKTDRLDVEYICYEDIYHGSGKNLIISAIFGILLSSAILWGLITTKKVTLYDSEGYKVLYKGQKVCINKEGELTVVIPTLDEEFEVVGCEGIE